MTLESRASQRLTRALVRSGVSERELARIGSVSRSTIYKFRQDCSRVRLAVVQRMARALGCSAAWLSFGLESKPLRLRDSDALVVRVELEDWNGTEVEDWVRQLQQALPGRPVMVLLRGDLEVMSEAEARKLVP